MNSRAKHTTEENALYWPYEKGQYIKAHWNPKWFCWVCFVLFVCFCFVVAGFCMVSFFQDRVSLSSLGCPGTHPLEQKRLALSSTCLCLSNAGIKEVCYHRLA